ncbi:MULTISPECIES: DUF6301 family protein [Streptomyces]|uniref:DUF6301 family protein n=2 Tax=Streptomyces TaxID=1883 RepID=A0ABU4K0D9_9ACTN|nr:DUF6301 family protein [Streptomyces roseolus]MDX2291158.1 DUF6301 family protein [Streptomyces roseolus]
MTEGRWRALGDAEVVRVAEALRALEWVPAGDEVPRRGLFRRRLLVVRAEGEVLGAGLGAGGAELRGRYGTVESVGLRVAETGDWAAGVDVFARMTGALSGPLGAPTGRRPGADADVRWEERDTALVLSRVSGAVRLTLASRAWLAATEEGR